ncbi:hypothetical protein G6F37_009197 [Rhizopus arrhizus]|nr:hypothetical protein G6F38_000953 [Rhizopus arrhizus]KAG1154721.1 hypothetical protein G6F37_009197 [Rhizopus arrhizus]
MKFAAIITLTLCILLINAGLTEAAKKSKKPQACWKACYSTADQCPEGFFAKKRMAGLCWTSSKRSKSDIKFYLSFPKRYMFDSGEENIKLDRFGNIEPVEKKENDQPLTHHEQRKIISLVIVIKDNLGWGEVGSFKWQSLNDEWNPKDPSAPEYDQFYDAYDDDFVDDNTKTLEQYLEEIFISSYLSS